MLLFSNYVYNKCSGDDLMFESCEDERGREFDKCFRKKDLYAKL